MRSLFFILLALLTASCREVVLRVEGLPSNTPAEAAIFVTGDFNYWDPADQSFRLTHNEDGTYYVTLPRGMGSTGYKFTRGDWTTIERDPCGHEIANRIADYLNSSDTVRVFIGSWKDLGPTNCNRVVLRIKSLPPETPPKDPIFLASNYGDWHANTAGFEFEKKKDGSYQLVIEPRNEALEYKITRGSWGSEAVDQFGQILPNQTADLGKQDTLDLAVEAWKDIDAGELPGPRTFHVHVPAYTPDTEPIYIAGNFNNWNPGDDRYRLTKTSAQLYSITLNKAPGAMLFKFVRGSWGKEECDAYRDPISNRRLRSGPGTTLDLRVVTWKDIEAKAPAPPVSMPTVLKPTPDLPNPPGPTGAQAPSRSLAGAIEDAAAGIHKAASKILQEEKQRAESRQQKPAESNPRTEDAIPVPTPAPTTAYPKSSVNQSAAWRKSDTIAADMDGSKYVDPGSLPGIRVLRVRVPDNTPEDADIYIAGNFNRWNPQDPNYRLKRVDDNLYTIIIDKSKGEMQFKFTRGSWDTEEYNRYHRSIENRKMRQPPGTVDLKIEAWRDK